MGITSEPMAAVSAMADPEMPPNMRQDTTVTTPRPPGRNPKRVRANSTIRLPTPPRDSSSPPKMNSGTAMRMKGSTPEMKLRKIVSRRVPEIVCPDHPDRRRQQRVHERHTGQGDDEKDDKDDQCEHAQAP